MGSQSEGRDFLLGFIFGGLVGAVLALLFAPQSGEETRAQIKRDWNRAPGSSCWILGGSPEESGGAVRRSSEAC